MQITEVQIYNLIQAFILLAAIFFVFMIQNYKWKVRDTEYYIFTIFFYNINLYFSGSTINL